MNKTDSNGTHVRLPDELLRAVESCRRCEPDIPSRPEMVRRLLRQAVAARLDRGDVGGDDGRSAGISR